MSQVTCHFIATSAKIKSQVHDEAKPFELEVNWICADSNYKHEIVSQALVKEAEDKAKAALEEEEDE